MVLVVQTVEFDTGIALAVAVHDMLHVASRIFCDIGVVASVAPAVQAARREIVESFRMV